ncbi:hypothetical protein BH708_06385 [Brachybacterium sp. P6-10-X1]|uniref:phage major capsid protein n=1 Tax=Brachybacterium sp. P6-10-X1 TaxID=1903186 RepID=UPI0009719F4F|nr:phage major capsid protein [Brachybacterium sp. P6-10-X1]APX32411.1 hypothetical protein BH708_06385 [Brachybacterium sp. P6-10-X1]
MTMLTTAESNRGILPAEYGALITDPVAEAALAFQPSIAQRVTTSGKTFRVPVLVEDAAAAWTAEGEEIAPSDPTLDEIEVTPAKVAGLTTISRELAEDSSPSAADQVGKSLARALTLQVDKGFMGNLAAPAAKGLGSITPTVVSGALDSLDSIHEAKAAAAAEGGAPSVLLVNPADLLALAVLKDQADSNRALLADTSVVAGLPVVSSRHVAAGSLWMLDATQIVTVLREDVTLAVSHDSHFTSDRVALRATLRVGFAFPKPAALVRIDLATAGA